MIKTEFVSSRRYDTLDQLQLELADYVRWLNNIRMHDTRHTAASLMLAQGTPVEVVSKILGHSNPTVTYNFYTHVLQSQQEEALSRMESQLFG
jgi:integrase